jgi:uncharacterized protein
MVRSFLDSDLALAPETGAGARLTDAQIDELDRLLDAVPQPYAPMDAAMLDGFLVGLLLQPEPVPAEAWQPYVFDVDARPEAAAADPVAAARVRELAVRRMGFLGASIAAREAFDPILTTLPEADGAGHAPDPSLALASWAAGFTNALHAFPALVERNDAGVAELLVGVYRHLPEEGADDGLRALRRDAQADVPLHSLDDALDDLLGCVLGIADLIHPRRPVTRAQPKVGRNAPCPCGSGRKFKQCHGRG